LLVHLLYEMVAYLQVLDLRMAFEVRFWVMLGICLSAVGGRSYSMDSMDSNTFVWFETILNEAKPVERKMTVALIWKIASENKRFTLKSWR